MNIRTSNDLLTGLLFAALGLVGTAIGAQYPFGDPSHMGAGFFPRIVAGMLVVTGTGLILRSFVNHAEPVGIVDPRPLLLLVGTLLFGVTIEDIGFPIAGVLLVVFAHLGGRAFKPLETGLLAIGLVALCVLLFVFALGMNLPHSRFW